MKISALIALSLISLNVMAAKLEKVSVLENSKLEALAKQHNKLLSIVGGCGSEERLKIISKKPAEQSANTAMQAIFMTNTEYSTPESIEAQAITDISVAIKEATYSTASRDGYRLNENQKLNLDLFTKMMNEVDFSNANLVAVQHGNSFGDSTALVITEADEMLIMQMGYCE